MREELENTYPKPPPRHMIYWIRISHLIHDVRAMHRVSERYAAPPGQFPCRKQCAFIFSNTRGKAEYPTCNQCIIAAAVSSARKTLHANRADVSMCVLSAGEAAAAVPLTLTASHQRATRRAGSGSRGSGKSPASGTPRGRAPR